MPSKRKAPNELPGNHSMRKVAPGVTLNCMAPKARDLMERALEEYQKHCRGIRSWKPNHRGSVYSFAYWLFRWSGLVDVKGNAR